MRDYFLTSITMSDPQTSDTLNDVNSSSGIRWP